MGHRMTPRGGRRGRAKDADGTSAVREAPAPGLAVGKASGQAGLSTAREGRGRQPGRLRYRRQAGCLYSFYGKVGDRPVAGFGKGVIKTRPGKLKADRQARKENGLLRGSPFPLQRIQNRNARFHPHYCLPDSDVKRGEAESEPVVLPGLGPAIDLRKTNGHSIWLKTIDLGCRYDLPRSIGSGPTQAHRKQ